MKDKKPKFDIMVDYVTEKLTDSLGEPAKGNDYEIKADKQGKWWISHKHVGSGEPLKQWIEDSLVGFHELREMGIDKEFILDTINDIDVADGIYKGNWCGHTIEVYNFNETHEIKTNNHVSAIGGIDVLVKVKGQKATFKIVDD